MALPSVPMAAQWASLLLGARRSPSAAGGPGRPGRAPHDSPRAGAAGRRAAAAPRPLPRPGRATAAPITAKYTFTLVPDCSWNWSWTDPRRNEACEALKPIEIHRPHLVVGSDPTLADVALDPSAAGGCIAGRHALFTRGGEDDGELFVEDLSKAFLGLHSTSGDSSPGGVQVDGRPLKIGSRARLAPGARVRLGAPPGPAGGAGGDAESDSGGVVLMVTRSYEPDVEDMT